MLFPTTHANGAIVLQPYISSMSVGLHNEQSSGAELRPKAPIAGGGEPDIVRLLPNYLVLYRDRSPKKTRKSYGLESKVHPKFPLPFRLSLG